MTLKAGNYLKVSRNLGLGSSPSEDHPEGAGLVVATSPKGTPLVDSSGFLIRATPAAVVDVVGVSLEDPHNNSSAGDTNIAFTPVYNSNNIVFRGQIGGGTTLDQNLTQTMLWGKFGLGYDTVADIWYVDVDESSSAQKCVTVIGLIDDVGTEGGLVEFVFNELGQLANDT